VGTAAPPLVLPSADGGGERSLAEFRGRPVLVSFLGPAHCSFCRAHVIRTIQHHDEFRRRSADVVFVAYQDPELLMSKMLRDLDLPFTLLLDPTLAAYRRWGLDQARLINWLAPGFYLGIAKFLLAREPDLGNSPGPVQMGGDFVVGRDGTLVFAHWMKSFHDRAAVPRLLSALDAA
jgi:peroxiredoxin